MRLTRPAALLFGLTLPLTAATTIATVSSAHADPPTIDCPTSPRQTLTVDIDGDGIADVVTAVPGAGRYGAVEIRYDRGSRATLLSPGHGLPDTSTGSGPALSVATANFNGDACTDLLVGLPRATVNGKEQAGAVQVLFGSKDGLVTGPLFTPDDPSFPGAAQAGEHFGAALAAGGPGVTAGAPGWTPTVAGTTVPHAGQAFTFTYYHQDTDQPTLENVIALRSNDPHPGDALGATVASRIAGAPQAVGNGQPRAGCFVVADVSVLTACGHHRDDHLGQTFTRVGSSIYVGSPDHDVAVPVTTRHHGKVRHHTRALHGAGVVEVFAFRQRTGGHEALVRTHVISQATRGVPGAPAAGNHFGASLSSYSGVRPDLAVGVPGWSLKHAPHAGAVLVRRGRTTSSPWQVVDRSAKGVAGAAHRGDAFGQSVILTRRGYPGNPEDFLLLVGVPGEAVSGRVDAGRVQVFRNDSSAVQLTNSQLLHRADGAAAHDRYGSSVR